MRTIEGYDVTEVTLGDVMHINTLNLPDEEVTPATLALCVHKDGKRLTTAQVKAIPWRIGKEIMAYAMGNGQAA